jgi:hypothetical protein
MLGIDFPRNPAPVGIVTGSIRNSRGEPVTNGAIAFNPAERTPLPWRRVTREHRQGRYSSLPLPAGTYVIEALTDGPNREFVSQLVHVQGTLELNLVTRPAFPVRGRVLIDGSPVSGSAASSLRISISSPTGHLPELPAPNLIVDADGAFESPGLAGRLVLRATGYKPPLALDRVMSRGMDVTDEGIDVRDASHSNIEVHLTSRPSRLEGEVIGLDRQPVNRLIVVFSEDPRWWTTFESRRVVLASGTSGKFVVTGLPAGRYLVAIGRNFDTNWADPVKLERMRATAASVTIADGATSSVTVRQR